MNKLIVSAVLGVACLAACSLSACGGEEEKKYTGSYTYEDEYSESTPKSRYGVRVEVCVKGDVITCVSVAEDTATLYNYTAIWEEDASSGDLGAEKAKAAVPNYLKIFEGKKVSEVKALSVVTMSNGAPDPDQKGGWTGYVLTGATQTSGRIVLAVQDALKNVK